MPRYFQIVVDVPLNQTFTYRENENLEERTLSGEELFGRRVEVPFGNRKISGIIVQVNDTLPQNLNLSQSKIREINKFTDTEPVLTKELFETAKWISRYYIASIGEAVFTMLPSAKKESSFSSFTDFEEESAFEKKDLSEEQKNAVDGILSDKEKNSFHYLYGMTGSGKTEVFLCAAEKVLSSGKDVIYLVPEIGLTPQVVEAVVKRFGNTVAVLHSELTPSQKFSEWKRILHGEAKVVIGARSAVFAPLKNLGLIIIDEEHDASYKSGSSPRYHARQVAMYRSSKLHIPLVMGSATPSVEAWKLMEEKKLIRHILSKRLAGGKLPDIHSIDLRLCPQDTGALSPELVSEITKTIENKKQAILFLNRRGFTHFFKCKSCGFELKCKNCSVSLTYHKNEKRLRCHYCGYNVEPPSQCPECGSLDVGYSGFGTEFIENEVKAKFPNARTIRIDSDNLKKGELQQKLDDFKKGEYDILLGTQMVAKGLNFPKLQLVGVVLADTALHLPDFRAQERTFSLLTQVAGRAGRYFPDGKVLIQSYSPEREVIKLAVENKTEDFYKSELEQRKILFFPPYSRLLRLVFRSALPNAAKTASHGAASILSHMAGDDVEILGPAECPIEMINKNYRYQILLRAKNISSLQVIVSKFYWGYTKPKNVYIEIDVDPVNML